MWTACDLIITGHCLDHESSSEALVCIRVRAGRYDDIYRMDEIKSLSFHIMFCSLFRGVAKYIVYSNTFSSFSLSDCDLYTPPTTRRDGRQNDQPGQNEELVTKRGTTSAKQLILSSWNTNNRAVCVRRLFLCERSALFLFLLTLNNYINTLICVRIPVFASILINTAI